MMEESINLPLISVIIPVYNSEKFLHYCLESVASQTYPHIEVILIDDGSTDSSGIICDKYCKCDDRFLVVHQNNLGRSAARNIGMSIAKGIYVYFMDSDDYIHARMLEVLYDAIQSTDCSFSMVLGKMVYGYDDSTEIESLNYKMIDRDTLIECMFQHSDNFYQFAVLWNKLIPMALIKDERFIDTASEDVDFNIRLFLKSNNAVLVNQFMYFWVQRKESVSHQQNYSIEIVKSYYFAYSRIPSYESKYKAYFLWDLYKRLLTAIYISEHTDFQANAKKTVSRILDRTRNDFITNNYISKRKKLVFFTFINFPIIYYCCPIKFGN